jgi:inner membrane protein
MSALGHVAVGVATARLLSPSGTPSDVLASRMAALSTLALLPDLDFLIPAVGPSTGPFAHRGASHSLVAAMVVGLIIAVAIKAWGGRRAIMWGIVATAVVASHPILDLFSDTDLGVALLWPLSNARFLAPWHILPNPPWPGVFSPFGLRQLGLEVMLFFPFWIYAFFPRRLIQSPSEGRPVSK